jgi:hypothetical protein
MTNFSDADFTIFEPPDYVGGDETSWSGATSKEDITPFVGGINIMTTIQIDSD